MEPIVLSGKVFSESVMEELKTRVKVLNEHAIHPMLTIVSTGHDDASKVYVRNKIKACEKLNIGVNHIVLDELNHVNLDRIEENWIDWPMIIQKPITGDVTDNDVAEFFTRHEDIDVDGFGYGNIAKLASNLNPTFYPCTPKGIMKLLSYYGIDVYGKNVTIIGRGELVGKPLARMMGNANATVTLCHTKTSIIGKRLVCAQADIIVTATGHRDTLCKFETAGKILVDTGINRDENGKLVGDINPENFKTCKAYTPVPGGVGPCTVAMLMENVVEFFERKLK